MWGKQVSLSLVLCTIFGFLLLAAVIAIIWVVVLLLNAKKREKKLKDPEYAERESKDRGRGGGCCGRSKGSRGGSNRDNYDRDNGDRY
jgi:hypothetical protein